MDSFTIASFGHLLMRVLLVGGLAAFLIFLGERAVGFDIKGAFNAIEKRAQDGDVWPVTAVLVVSIIALAYILG